MTHDGDDEDDDAVPVATTCIVWCGVVMFDGFAEYVSCFIWKIIYMVMMKSPSGRRA